MKKIILSVAVLVAFGVAGCNNRSNSSDPRQVLISFIEALGKKDFEGAKKYATKDSESMFGMIQMTMPMVSDNSKDPQFDTNNMEFGNAKIEGNIATVPVKNKRSSEALNYMLKKENGSWKVAFDMATMMQMAADKLREKGMDINKMLNKLDTVSKGFDMNKLIDTTHLKDTSH